MSFGDQFHIELRKPLSVWDTTTSPDTWFNSTEAALRKIASVDAGTVLLDAVLGSGFWVAVEPLNFDNVCNAHGAGRLEIQRNRTFKGVVKFDAKVFQEGSPCFKSRLGSKYDRGGHSDEVLFHEMVHALRGGLEINDDKRALNGALWRYDNTEEFLAIVLTNIYIADETNSGASGLRAGHRGKMSLEKYFSTSLCFFASSTQILSLLKTFRKRQGELFDALAKIKAKFNPLKAMVEFPALVERISNAKATKENERTAEKHQKWVDEKYLAEIRKAIKEQKAKDQKELETFFSSIAKMTPDQLSAELGLLGRQAVDMLAGR